MVPPQTRIKHEPHSSTRTSAVVRLTSSEAGSTFECRLDRAGWHGCTKRLHLRHLSAGKHTVRVRAVDAAGNVDPTPARASWRVLPS